MRRLGVGAALDRAAAVLPQWTFCDVARNALCATDLVRLWGDVGPCLGVTRARLQQVLTEAAAGIRYRLGTAVTELTPDHDRVEVGFNDGSTEHYELVVGADGVHSTIRRDAIAATEPSVRDAALRERGDAMLRARYEPLRCEP